MLKLKLFKVNILITTTSKLTGLTYKLLQNMAFAYFSWDNSRMIP